MFELSAGEEISAFAVRFRQRLEQTGLYDCARTIVAANALYLEAPYELLADNAARDALDRLCSEDQMHFRVVCDADGCPIGIWLAHPHLAYLLFKEWPLKSTNAISVETALGRECCKIFQAFDRRGNFEANNFFKQILLSERFNSLSGGIKLVKKEVFKAFFEEWYRNECEQSRDKHLTAWLRTVYRSNELSSFPYLLRDAWRLFEKDEEDKSAGVHFYCYLWCLSEAFSPEKTVAIKKGVNQYFHTKSDEKSIGGAFEIIASSSVESSANLIYDWVNKHRLKYEAGLALTALMQNETYGGKVEKMIVPWCESHRQTPEVLNVLAKTISAYPSNKIILNFALDWCESNLNNPKVFHMLSTIVSTNPGDKRVPDITLDWFESNLNNPKAFHVLSAIVSTNPGDKRVLNIAMEWCRKNQKHPMAYEVLRSIVVAIKNSDDVHNTVNDMLAYTLKWCGDNQEHPGLYELLKSLIANYPDNKDVFKFVLDWLDNNSEHEHCHDVLTTTIANSDDDWVLSKALSWLDNNKEHAQYSHLLIVTTAAHPGNDDVLLLAENWLTKNKTSKNFSSLLENLMAKSSDKKRWSTLAKTAFQEPDVQHREKIVTSLLKVNNAHSDYINMALDFIEIPKNKIKMGFVFRALKEALLRNPKQLLVYWEGSQPKDRKLTVLKNFAKALNARPDLINDDVIGVTHKLDPDYVGVFLTHFIYENEKVCFLDELISNWLESHFRKKGYGKFISALSRNKTCFDRLKPNLKIEIVSDVNALEVSQ